MKLKSVLISVAALLFVMAVGSFLLTTCVDAIRAAHITQCMSNLKQIGTLAEIFRKTYGEYPPETGEAWHLRLIDIISENKDNSVFQCPSEGDTSSTGSDYRGPSKNMNVAHLGKSDPIAADKCPGGKTQHFGDNEKWGVFGLMFGLQAVHVREGEVRWRDFGPDSPFLKD